MSIERKRGFIRPDEDDAIAQPERWGLPDYGSEQPQAKPTAFNYDPGWVPSMEIAEEEPELVLTEEQIELIKQGAYQEGLMLGQEAGFTQGYEKGKAEGLQAGHDEGLAAGHAEGVDAGKEQIEQQVSQFIQLADQFAEPLQLMNGQVEKQLVDMVLCLVKEVVHVEVQTNPQVILDTLKASVESLPITGHEITLHLHPEDVEIVQQAYGEAQLAARQWQLSAEPSLSRGDLQISAGESSVSYKMEERIKQVLQNFCAANRHQGGE